MLRQIMVGVCAGVIAILVMALLRRDGPPPLMLGPDVVKAEGIDAYLPRRAEVTARKPPGDAIWPVVNLDRVIERVEFKNTPIRDVIDWLRKASGISIHANFKALDAAGLSPDTPINLSGENLKVAAILQLIAWETGSAVAYRVDKGVVEISTDEILNSQLVLRIYNVRDLMVQAMRFSLSYETAVKGKTPTTLPVVPPSLTRTPRSPPKGWGMGSYGGGGSMGWGPRQLSAEEEAACEMTAIVEAVIKADPAYREDDKYAVNYWAGKLLVSTTPKAHERVEKAINDLRASGQ